jgi:hypothetical protein
MLVRQACSKFRLSSDRTLSSGGVHVRTNRKRPLCLSSARAKECRVNTYPFTINSHCCLVVDSEVLDFRDIPNALHICGVTASTENHCDTRPRIDVRRRDERSGCIIDERSQFRRHILKVFPHQYVRQMERDPMRT